VVPTILKSMAEKNGRGGSRARSGKQDSFLPLFSIQGRKGGSQFNPWEFKRAEKKKEKEGSRFFLSAACPLVNN